MINTIHIGLQWWNAWRESSINTRIFVAMLTVGGFTVLVKIATAAKELVVAYQFGTMDVLDAFLIALLLPGFALTLVCESLNTALIPTYIQVREKDGQQAAQYLFSSVMMWGTGFLLATSLILAFSVPYLLPLLASGFGPEKLALTTSLSYFLLPWLFIGGVATTWGALLNAQDRFAVAATVPVVTSLLTVLILLLLARYLGIYALALGTVLGGLLEAAILKWWLARQGISILPRWHGVTPAVKEVWHQYVPVVTASFLIGSTSLISQSMATLLGPGNVSALAYASKTTTLVLGVLSLAIGTAVLPHFSRMVATAQWKAVRHALITYTRLIVLITLPLTLILIYFSEPLVRLFFQRGAFTEGDTHLVATVQALHLLQVPVYVLGILAVKLISALKANRTLLWTNGINLVFNIITTYILMNWMGVAGIALSTSLMYFLNTSLLFIMAFRLMSRHSN